MARLSRNDRVFFSCIALVGAMVGLSYAAVPLYRIFCQATGYGGTPNRAAAAPETVSGGHGHEITVRFDSNVDPNLNWLFQPEMRSVQVRAGDVSLAFFKAVNRDAVAVTGHAAFNVTPERAAVYFSKIECFCFTEQTLEAGQSVDMPVQFFISPEILEDREGSTIKEITLSYTFFPSVNQRAAAVGSTRGTGG